MKRSAILIGVLMTVASAASAQDSDWVRAWEAAQRQRPQTVASTSRIALANEPGTPLVVHGRLFREDGRTPIAGAIVFAYHTDARGHYSDAQAAHSWRLRGWAKSDANGRFTFHTIRPGASPQGRSPAHLHLTIEAAGIGRRFVDEVNFADDPLVSDRAKAASAAAGAFGFVRPVTTRAGAQHIDLRIRVAATGRF
jgi:protocatechuate 3,4-dioxygenase beta subunit